MANNKSSMKRIRQNKMIRLRKKYYHKSTRTAIKKFKVGKNVKYSTIVSMLDKLSKKNIIHKNKAARLKSKLAKMMAHSSIG
ncbi:MAG: 30S ribosomal protein S20 [Candidatus Bostrichicola ureolyticus]|nr:MAG: 30S ribosomal protein S20 [Candidatus Bostrichicola ureolyticus]WGH27920.1 MAG: 30S ribosomal protein S20 [Candidatus Bostrichicola ureolyticus]